jgi:hypothetical protein
MLAATEAAASLAGQTAAIQAQLPHFYGGSGSSGLFVEVPFTGGVLPSGFVGNPTSALYTTFSAATDSETVSGIWSAIIPLNTLRGLFLRSNVSESTFVYALWQVVGDPGASASGGYYIPNNPGASFTLQIGCNVAGTTTVLANFGPYPLWQYAGNVVIVSWTQIEVGPWYNRQTEYTPNYGPGYNALQGHSMYLASSNNAISLEATADTFTLEYPYAGSLSVTDTTPVSLMGSLYRYAGYIDNGGIPGSMLSWAFYDSGPSAGPSEAYVVTQESTTFTIYTDLTTTTDQVTVTIGSSGLAMVFISAQLVNVTAGDGCIVGFALSGATTQAANLSYSLIYQTASGAGNDQRGNAFLLTGLAPGPTTFKMKYAALNGGTALFSLRRIAVIPL